MWAAGVYDLGLTAAAFLDLTPRQFDALFERHQQAEQRADARAALVCSVLANVNRDPKKRSSPYHVSDFMPGAAKSNGHKELPPHVIQPVEDQLAWAKMLTLNLAAIHRQKKANG
jgi:hypothetical protein